MIIAFLNFPQTDSQHHHTCSGASKCGSAARTLNKHVSICYYATVRYVPNKEHTCSGPVAASQHTYTLMREGRKKGECNYTTAYSNNQTREESMH